MHVPTGRHGVHPNDTCAFQPRTSKQTAICCAGPGVCSQCSRHTSWLDKPRVFRRRCCHHRHRWRRRKRLASLWCHRQRQRRLPWHHLHAQSGCARCEGCFSSGACGSCAASTPTAAAAAVAAVAALASHCMRARMLLTAPPSCRHCPPSCRRCPPSCRDCPASCHHCAPQAAASTPSASCTLRACMSSLS